MALFALYRVLASENTIQVLLSDVRPGGRSVQHHCSLPNWGTWLVRELTDELNAMGFVPEFDRRTKEGSEVRFFCVHRLPTTDVSSAAAIRNICLRNGITAPILTHRDDQIPLAPRSRSSAGRG